MSLARDIADLGAVTSRLDTVGGSIGALSNRNLVINGAMQVAQRGTSSTGLGASSGYFTIDRINPNFSGTSAGRLTMTQETITDLAGFTKCLKLDCTTADTSISAGEYILLNMQAIEGQNLQHIAKGTSLAKKLTLSFYVKANAAATYVCELQDSNSRKINKSFSVTTDWTRVVMTFDADTDSGGTIVNSNAKGLDVLFWLHAGSNFNSGSAGDLNTSWGSPSNNTRAAGISSFFDSTNRTFFVTGVQLEVGDTATDFEHRSFADELLRCQRYFNRSYTYGVATAAADNNTPIAHMSRGGSYNIIGQFFHPRDMRAAPTVVIYNPNNGTVNQLKGDGSSFANAALLVNSPKGATFFVNGTSITATIFLFVHATFDAEL